ncbi:hypothetical protein HYD60_03895 [Mycoplasmopsis bovis]|nr:hypothetical protein [Mycoplasmopsis bovis]QQH60870.1 hypothetical protein HYD60_03895 [Mycoplasmopsis bovis]
MIVAPKVTSTIKGQSLKGQKHLKEQQKPKEFKDIDLKACIKKNKE